MEKTAEKSLFHRKNVYSKQIMNSRININNFKVMFIFVNERMRTFIPLNISYLSAALKRGGFSTCLFDTSFYKEQTLIHEERKKEEAGFFEGVDYRSIGVRIKEGNLVRDLLGAVEREEPQLIAFSVFSQSKNLNYKLAGSIKTEFPRIPIIFGGVHVNIEPEVVLKKDFVDYICIGEGEEAIVELAGRLANGITPEDVKNIGLKINGKIHINPVREPPVMDNLPFPDWDLFEEYHLYGPFRGKLWRMGVVECSRSCPYNCTYCGNDIMRRVYRVAGWPLRYRYKSPQRWIAELKRMKDQYGINFLFVSDGTFLAQEESDMGELADLYQREIALPFFCCSTVFDFTPRRARLLKKMGCVCVNVGIESGSDRYRRKYMNRKMSNEQIINAFALGKEEGMEMRSYNIIGMPFETREDIFETIELNRQAKVDSCSLAIFVPYHGTVLRELCIEKGLLDPAVEITGDGTKPMIKNPYLSDEELTGLFNTFLLYVKAPKKLFTEIHKAEKNTPEGLIVRKELIQKINKSDGCSN